MSKKSKKETDIEEGVNATSTQVDTDTTQEEVVEQLSPEEQLKSDLQQEKDKFLRLFAEFENYKKRTSKERVELFQTASKDVMVSMLPILDDFERALLHIDDDKEAEELRKGVLLIYNKLLNALQQKGLATIEVRKGDVFNADHHEAITQIPAPTDDLKGKIIDVIEKGYKLGETVIRFPKVIIGQ
ncbi:MULTISPECIES: nucleotide exchange factor GrpE [unclassified Olleya]|uniref:nucleotide exchange factor GrpE n=1 Tax=unclassified Olleya TaxID=2615019 RepID=UPI000C305BFE|nr:MULTISPECIES: nucleotide exchange factor GrpE [unclassified Olleya]AUC75575.1 nucleotide exchange factor GrpE [Olleya sp. Bg11-27]QXP61470.1 nucleotide exchange factor GrpE [Olleya sp. HaHaR_3_96]